MTTLPELLSSSPVPTFTPVPNRTRTGWTAAKQRMFIETLAATGSVRLSAEAAGMGHFSVYKLRHAPGGDSFGHAWDEAVGLAASRVRDVLIDQAIHGIPERVTTSSSISGGRDTVVERRRFNHRTMIWVLQHHMPNDYPGGSTTHRGGWGGRKLKSWEKPEPSIEDVRAEILRKVEAMGRHKMLAIAADPAKRAAYELLNGPWDWTPFETGALR